MIRVTPKEIKDKEIIKSPMTQNIQENLSEKDRIEEVLTRGVVDIVNRDHLLNRLTSGDKLRVKFGIDPTGLNVHIGRASSVRKLLQFQELGHQIVLIIGDFTATIGDASDKTESRRMLSREEVFVNEQTYLQQIGKILDISRAEVRHNSEWLSKLTPGDWIKLASNFTVQQMISRDNFAERIKNGVPVGLQEFLYPLAQGYDSVMVKSDVEVGGTDQLFNFMAGRKLQEVYGQEPQDILMIQLLTGTDGRKMSTSWGNVINILSDPNEKYGRTMSIPDQLIPVYMEMATNIPMQRVKEVARLIEDGSVNPIELKKELAFEIVRSLDGQKAAEEAVYNFQRIVQNKEVPDSQIPIAVVTTDKLEVSTLLNMLKSYNITKSKNEGRRLFEQGGISVEGAGALDSQATTIDVPEAGLTFRIGKRRFLKIVKEKTGSLNEA